MLKQLKSKITILALTQVLACSAFASQSSITEADGASCMGDDKSKKQTETAALQDAKRLAVEFTKSHVESETIVENFELKNDLIRAFAQADVKVLEIVSKKWDDPATGDCVEIRIKAEVVPSEANMPNTSTTALLADPRLPLNVKVWTSAEQYADGETMRVYLQGNKPFYARLVYQDASGNNLQILPNQHRLKNYFAGGTIFEVPSAEDQFQLNVSAPYGAERLTLYASTNQLGRLETAAAGDDVFIVTEAPAAIPAKTRGISIAKPGTNAKPSVAEFSEASVAVTIHK